KNAKPCSGRQHPSGRIVALSGEEANAYNKEHRPDRHREESHVERSKITKGHDKKKSRRRARRRGASENSDRACKRHDYAGSKTYAPNRRRFTELDAVCRSDGGPNAYKCG